MIVELHGAQFKNKGAQLMLRTVVHEVTSRIDHIEFAVGTQCGNQTERDRLGLKQIKPVRPWMDSKYNSFVLAVQEWLSAGPGEKVAEHLNHLTLQKVDALIDLSGFAFTDHWGVMPIKNFAILAETYRRQGKPVVMLPQAVGPFENEQSRNAFRRLIKAVDILYLRDIQSIQYAQQIAGQDQRIRFAPDLTLFYSPPVNHNLVEEPYCCIIPSKRMFEQGGDDWGSTYRDYIHVSVRESRRQGYEVYIVVHDLGDLKTAEDIAESYKEDHSVRIYQEDDPVILKQFIGGSDFVIGSRYHGILAAFSYGVPALCMGWAHKYEFLYREFKLDDYLLTPEISTPELLGRISQVASSQINRKIRGAILEKIEEYRVINQEMWDTVIKTITR